MFPSEQRPSLYFLLNFFDSDNEAVTVLSPQIPNGLLTLMTHNLSHGSAKVFWMAKSSYPHPTKYTRNHISLCESLWVIPSKNWTCLNEFSNMSVVSMHIAQCGGEAPQSFVVLGANWLHECFPLSPPQPPPACMTLNCAQDNWSPVSGPGSLVSVFRKDKKVWLWKDKISYNLAVVVLLSNLSVKLGWRKRCRELPSAVYNLLLFPRSSQSHFWALANKWGVL